MPRDSKVFITKTSLNLKITELKNIKNILRVGQIVEATIVEKKGNLKYTVNIKNNLFEAQSNIPITTSKLKLMVKQITPQIVLKIVEPEEDIINFIKHNQPIIIEDKNELIKQAINTLKEALSRDDRLKAIVQITKLSGIVDSDELKIFVKKLEEKLIKQRIFDKDGIEKLIDTLSSKEYKNSKKFVHLIKEGLKNVTYNQTNNENLFLQLPLIINSKQEEIYLKKETKNEPQVGKSFKISLIWNHKKLGMIQIDGIYTNGSVSCNVYFKKEESLKSLLSKEDELKKLINGVNLSLNLMKKEPILRYKRLNIKI